MLPAFRLRRYHCECLLLLAGLLLLGAVCAWSSLQQYRRLEQSEGERLQAAATTLGSIVGQRLNAAGRSLKAIADNPAFWRGEGGEHGLGDAGQRPPLLSLADAVEGIDTLAILDSTGRVIAASRNETLGQDWSSRESFTRARRQRDAVWIALGTATDPGGATLGVARSIIDGRGNFAGVVSATLDPDDVNAWMDALRYAPEMWTALATADASLVRIVAQRPGLAAGAPGAELLARQLASGKLPTLLQGTVEASGDALSMAVAPVPAGEIDRPLWVAVARGRALIAERWRSEALLQGALFLAVVVASVFGLWAVQRRRQRLDDDHALGARQSDQHGQAETELRTLSRAVEQSAAAVLITDITGYIEYVNPAACMAYGYSAAELLGANPRLFSSGLTPPQTHASLWSTILAGQVWRGDLENRRRDGSLIHVATSISPVRDAAGRISHFVAIQEDVSAMVAASRMKDALEARLSRFERMEVLGTMAGSVAHDFNNILVAILGFSGLGRSVLQAAGGPARVVAYFEEIEIAGERAHNLVQQLLAFSRGGPLKLTTVSLPEVVVEVLDLLAPSFPAAVTLSARLADDLPQLDIDRSHLHRLLINLCRNARDAMNGPGEVVIDVRTIVVEAAEICASCHTEFAGAYLRIAVIDAGQGIAAAIREHIFEPFFTTREVGAGSGMGLAVVHGLLHLYGGHLQVAAAPAQGTEMAILLPRSMWHIDQPASEEVASAP